MVRPSFLDTNVLLYSVDRSDLEKQERALGLIARHAKERNGVISTQVLQEFFSAATRKLGIAPLQARQQLRDFRVIDIVQVTPELIEEGNVAIGAFKGISREFEVAREGEESSTISRWSASSQNPATIHPARNLPQEEQRNSRMFCHRTPSWSSRNCWSMVRSSRGYWSPMARSGRSSRSKVPGSGSR